MEMPLNIECFMDDKDVSGKMNRETMEELAVGLLLRIENTMKAVLQYSSKLTSLGCSRIHLFISNLDAFCYASTC